jgi:hypothetical protein
VVLNARALKLRVPLRDVLIDVEAEAVQDLGHCASTRVGSKTEYVVQARLGCSYQRVHGWLLWQCWFPKSRRLPVSGHRFGPLSGKVVTKLKTATKSGSWAENAYRRRENPSGLHRLLGCGAWRLSSRRRRLSAQTTRFGEVRDERSAFAG